MTGKPGHWLYFRYLKATDKLITWSFWNRNFPWSLWLCRRTWRDGDMYGLQYPSKFTRWEHNVTFSQLWAHLLMTFNRRKKGHSLSISFHRCTVEFLMVVCFLTLQQLFSLWFNETVSCWHDNDRVVCYLGRGGYVSTPVRFVNGLD